MPPERRVEIEFGELVPWTSIRAGGASRVPAAAPRFPCGRASRRCRRRRPCPRRAARAPRRASRTSCRRRPTRRSRCAGCRAARGRLCCTFEQRVETELVGIGTSSLRAGGHRRRHVFAPRRGRRKLTAYPVRESERRAACRRARPRRLLGDRSSARLSASTLTRGSPSMPKVRPLACLRRPARAPARSGRPRALATRAT